MELSFDFEDREYELGDTIDIMVDLKPNGAVDVRQARVDLVCEQRFVRRAPPQEVWSAKTGVTSRGPYLSPYVAFQSQEETKETYVHSTQTFLAAERLKPGATIKHVALKIESAPPKHLEEARSLDGDAHSSWTFKWRLMASGDIVRGRNPKRQRTVKVRLPASTRRGNYRRRAAQVYA